MHNNNNKEVRTEIGDKKKKLDSRSFVQLRFGDSKQVGELEYNKKYVPQPGDQLPGEDGDDLRDESRRTGDRETTCEWCGKWDDLKVCLHCGTRLEPTAARSA